MCMEPSPNVSSIYSVSFGSIWYNSDSSKKLISESSCYELRHSARSLLPMSAVAKTRPLVASNTSCDLLWQTLAISCHSWNHENLYTRCQWLNYEKWETVLTSQFHHGQWPLVTVCKCLRPFPAYILKVGYAGYKNPQMILNFPQRDCLRPRKLSAWVSDNCPFCNMCFR